MIIVVYNADDDDDDGDGLKHYIGRKEGNVLFNDTLKTFDIRLYGLGK